MWWQTDEYTGEDPIPQDITDKAGPVGVALVRVFDDGKTTSGWGEDRFMQNYLAKKFHPAPAVVGFERGLWAFAFVMRSVQIVCIDIDGKNGGLKHAGKLGMLPHTLAETSKSGDGYHLYYSTDEEWDNKLGFARFRDRTGLEQGVDFRATGCVYHHDTQRWNNRPIAPLPEHLATRLEKKMMAVAAIESDIAKILSHGDDWEVQLMHEALTSDLAKPIPAGRRNNTLFAIGSQLMLAQVDGWEALVSDRAAEVGLPDAEIDKLISNIQKYGAKSGG